MALYDKGALKTFRAFSILDTCEWHTILKCVHTIECLRKSHMPLCQLVLLRTSGFWRFWLVYTKCTRLLQIMTVVVVFLALKVVWWSMWSTTIIFSDHSVWEVCLSEKPHKGSSIHSQPVFKRPTTDKLPIQLFHSMGSVILSNFSSCSHIWFYNNLINSPLFWSCFELLEVKVSLDLNAASPVVYSDWVPGPLDTSFRKPFDFVHGFYWASSFFFLLLWLISPLSCGKIWTFASLKTILITYKLFMIQPFMLVPGNAWTLSCWVFSRPPYFATVNIGYKSAE